MKILMVCLGNICRSPLAEGIMHDLINENQLTWEVDSAGTSGYHSGEAPDPRSIETAHKHQIDISNQKSRQLVKSDLETFDLILTMDASNYRNTLALCSTEEQRNKVKILLNYSHPGQNRQVPDPYYEGGFEHVFQLIKNACVKVVEAYK